MFFASDNGGPAHPNVMRALMRANDGYASAYGADPIMEEVRAQIREIFEAPQAAVYLVATGTAANALTLAALCNPWQTVFCTPMAHIQEDECNAPEFFTGGAKLTLVEAVAAKMTPDTLRRAIMAEETRGVHGPQRGPVSITQATEKGTVHSCAEIAALSAVAHEYGLKVHLDGARFANALVALDCTPAEMTWKAGVDAVCFGGTKNGLLGVEACVFFDPADAATFELRRKRGAHLFSKHRYLSAQMQAYLSGDLWLDMARSANARGQRLLRGLQQMPHVQVLFDPPANLLFFDAPRAVHARALNGGALYYVMGGDPHVGDPEEMLTGRLVADWSGDDQAVDDLLDLLRA
ncbi:L-threonine aldolase [Loktanella sp. DSM 29012]|uniref:Low specificity L-threonine aldolase n=1 Tax=Loktanella gaetbuli TaxID=2881335 RepID=A0ABS8BXW2_9RHOB|nr:MULTISPECIES: beta-eliminating lyase-related protein [Loktanella]MCB5200356.1 low specificity L-threonine aldolase [Loktanella gaetbuli]SEP74701.1 L-threonine aldolase [Loktanella sp. DSM 29012]